MKYILAPFEFRALVPGMRASHCLPAGVSSAIDPRPLAECAAASQGATNAIMGLADAAPLPAGAVQIATDLDETVTAANRLRLRNSFNAPQALTSTRLGDILHELFTLQGDPDQVRCCGPLLPTAIGLQFEIHLGGQVKRKPFDISGPEWPLVQAQMRAMYRSIRADVLLGRAPAEFHRKALGFWLRKFKFDDADFERFVPDDLPRETPRQPATSLAENFNTADSSILGPTYSWTEYLNNAGNTSAFGIDTNRVEVSGPTVTGGDASARADSDVSGTDHYSEIDVVVLTSPGTNNNQWGACTRFSSSAQTHYLSRLIGILNALHLGKWVAGTGTDLASVGVTVSLPVTVRQTSNGTSISDSYGGVAKNSVTDSAITTGTRGGLWGYSDNTDQAMGDNWAMSDIAASAGHPTMRRWGGVPFMGGQGIGNKGPGRSWG